LNKGPENPIGINDIIADYSAGPGQVVTGPFVYIVVCDFQHCFKITPEKEFSLGRIVYHPACPKVCLGIIEIRAVGSQQKRRIEFSPDKLQ
jgi:hypothetical protein